MQTCSADEETPTKEQSQVLMRNLLRTTLASLFWARAIFPQECFENRLFAGMSVKKFLPGSCEQVDNVIKWIEDGVMDAFNKGYLETLIVGIEGEDEKKGEGEGEGESHMLLESYTCIIKYDGSLSLSSNSMPTSPVKTPNKRNVRESALQMMRNIALVVQTFSPLPETHYVVMKLLYRDNITPPDYDPPHFRCATDDPRMLFVSPALKVKVGGVETMHHRLDLLLQSTADSLASNAMNSCFKESEDERDAEKIEDCCSKTVETDQKKENSSQQGKNALLSEDDAHSSQSSCSQSEGERKTLSEESQGDKDNSSDNCRIRSILQFLLTKERVTLPLFLKELKMHRKEAQTIIASLENDGIIGPSRCGGRIVNINAVRQKLHTFENEEPELCSKLQAAQVDDTFMSSQSQPQTPPLNVNMVAVPATTPIRCSKIEDKTDVKQDCSQKSSSRKRKASIAEDPRIAKHPRQ